MFTWNGYKYPIDKFSSYILNQLNFFKNINDNQSIKYYEEVLNEYTNEILTEYRKEI